MDNSIWDIITGNNLSVNTYLPSSMKNASPEEKEKWLEEERKKLLGIISKSPEELSIWDSAVSIGNEPTRTGGGETLGYLTSNKDPGEWNKLIPQVRINTDIPGMFHKEVMKHENAHAKGMMKYDFLNPLNIPFEQFKGTNSIWDLLTTNDWQSKIKRFMLEAQKNKDNNWPESWEKLLEAKDYNRAFEEYASEKYGEGMKKPTWMSEEQWTFLKDYLKPRFNIWSY